MGMKGSKSKEQMRKMKDMTPLFEKHSFWDTQPVIHLTESSKPTLGAPIEIKEVKDVRPEPLALPAGFVWSVVDLNNDKEMEEVPLLIHRVGIRALARQLCGGHGQHVQIQVFGAVSEVGAEAAGVHSGVDLGGASGQEQAAGGLYHGDTSQGGPGRERDRDGGDQLLVCA